MTIVTIESDSAETTAFLMKIAEERGLSAKTDEHRVLTDDDVTFGFGRKATEAELTEYLLATESDEWIDLDEVRAKFSTNS